MINKAWSILHYHVLPPLFILFFTSAVQFLVYLGDPSYQLDFTIFTGNGYSWAAVTIFTTWAVLMLKIPAKSYYGPETADGTRPRYHDNGLLYYILTSLWYTILICLRPDVAGLVYDNLGQILGTLNISALVLCGLLLIKGRSNVRPSTPVVYQFYSGVEVHPQVFGIDIKQLTNCRIGMMLWQVLILTYLVVAVDRHGMVLSLEGMDWGFVVNVVLQTVYIFKFFWWETGYFTTLDITLDAAGYYICWGCLVWVPSFYAFSSFYFVHHLPNVSNSLNFFDGKPEILIF